MYMLCATLVRCAVRHAVARRSRICLKEVYAAFRAWRDVAEGLPLDVRRVISANLDVANACMPAKRSLERVACRTMHVPRDYQQSIAHPVGKKHSRPPGVFHSSSQSFLHAQLHPTRSDITEPLPPPTKRNMSNRADWNQSTTRSVPPPGNVFLVLIKWPSQDQRNWSISRAPIDPLFRWKQEYSNFSCVFCKSCCCCFCFCCRTRRNRRSTLATTEIEDSEDAP